MSHLKRLSKCPCSKKPPLTQNYPGCAPASSIHFIIPPLRVTIPSLCNVFPLFISYNAPLDNPNSMFILEKIFRKKFQCMYSAFWLVFISRKKFQITHKQKMIEFFASLFQPVKNLCFPQNQCQPGASLEKLNWGKHLKIWTFFVMPV